MKWSNQERVKRGKYNLGSNRILGYDSVDGELVPNEDAETVRMIYDLFLEGRSVGEISKILNDIGVRTNRGTLFSNSGIYYILQNETYRGDKFLQKKPPRDLMTKKPDPKAKYESNYLEGDHEAIVAPELWDAAQARMAEIKRVNHAVGHRGGRPHFLYGKVFCECGEPMTRKTVNGIGGRKCKTWTCRDQCKKGSTCNNRKVKEDVLMAEISEAMGWDSFDEELLAEQVRWVTVKDDGLEIEKIRQGMPA